jgi:site-specific recombinase XerD
MSQTTARAPRNKGRRFPADPPRVEEIVAVMKRAGHRPTGLRLRAAIVVMWRSGLRVSEALTLSESELEPSRGALLVRRGKGGKRREVGMDDWGWEQLRPWIEERRHYPVGPLFCVIHGPSQGTPWSASGVRTQLCRVAARAGVRRRFAPHQLRHAHAVEMARERVPLNVPAPARSCEPRSDLDLSAGNRQRRGNRGGQRAQSTDDPGRGGVGSVALLVLSATRHPPSGWSTG